MELPQREDLGFKTDVPSLDGAIPRPSLVDRLREGRARAQWLHGPAGSGKSTLAAAYARDAEVPFVWYRLDERDDDPAFFYAAVRATLSSGSTSGDALPAFDDDDRRRLDAFADRFATALDAGRPPTLFVFDDVHRPGGGVLHRALAAFVGRAQRHAFLFVGERPPPEPLYPAIAARQLSVCTAIDLAFDDGECAVLAEAAGLRCSGADLRSLTGGHAAALVLACELWRVAPEGTRDAVAGSIHRFLLGRMLERMPSSHRDLLLATGFAPHFTRAIAAALAPPDTVAAIDELVAHGLLRKSAIDGEPLFEAHGLLRSGLEHAIRQLHGEPAARVLALRTAAALRVAGFGEDAFALFVDHGDAAAAASLLEDIGRDYVRRGQADLLVRALGRLPPGEIERRPALALRAGEALLGVDEARARDWFARAYDAYAAAGDRAGTRVAAARVVTAMALEYGDLRTLDEWIARHEAAGAAAAIAPGSPDETALLIGVLCVAFVRGAYPAGTDGEALVRRLRKLVDDPTGWPTVNERMVGARLLLEHGRIFRTPELAKTFITATRALADASDASALQRGRWHLAAASVHFNEGEHERATEHLDVAEQLVAQTGSARLAFELGMARVDASLKRNDLDDAGERLVHLETLARTATPAQRAEHARITARTLLLQGRPPEGLRWAEEALAAASLAGYSGSHARLFVIERVYALAANERLAEAIAAAEALQEGVAGNQREAALAIHEALAFLAGGRREVALLERALGRAEAAGFVNILSRARPALALLCQSALATGTHPPFAERLITLHALDPPAGAGPEWPWPVKVRTLGGFALEIASKRYRPAHKTQDKPLELLKLLIAAQALGRDSLERGVVAERLWPDADEPNARKSLDMTLSRLRKLLKDDAAVVLAEGRLQLSDRHVWNDVGALVRALRRAGAHRDDKARQASPRHADAAADVRAVLEHLAGPFLPDDVETPWLLAGREAVAGAVRSALMIADAVIDPGDPAFTAALERAVAADPTSEDLARALMRVHVRAGRHPEAVRVYRRLREMLSIVLCLAPSRETEDLRAEVYADAPDGAARAAPGRSTS